MDATELLEHACADAWPALVDTASGEWRMRAAGGFTGRANSTLIAGEPGTDVPAALRRARRFARDQGIPARTMVPAGSRFESALTADGWRIDHGHSGPDGVLVLTGGLHGFPPPDRATTVEPRPPAGWWSLTVAAERPSPAQRHVLSTGGPAGGLGFGARRSGGELVGAVRGALVGDLLHISRLAVPPAHRRAGHARATLAGLAAWARDAGARRCALQVLAGNTAAVRLYRALGCVEHHRYHYWTPRED